MEDPEGEAAGERLDAEFVRTLDASLARIARFPGAYPAVWGRVRRAPMRRFPYSVFYISRGPNVHVLACLHERRSPRSWPKTP